MKYINKNDVNNKSICDGIVNAFIENQKDLGKDCSYYCFGITQYKNELRDALIEEQHNLCCYCMRKLSNDQTTTLEHIIPRNSSDAELEAYKANNPVWFTEVIHLSNFNNTRPTPPFPHSVAYQNLVASCKGILKENSNESCCCNNKRGHHNIRPIFLDDNIDELIEYSCMSGTVKSSNADTVIDNTLSLLGLNDNTLKEIRSLWALVVKKHILIDSKGNSRELVNAFGTDLVSQVPDRYIKYVKNSYYWKLFISYKWFEGYYLHKVAI